MFRTVPLSIISSFSLYTQQWYMSYMFADSLRAGSGLLQAERLINGDQWDVRHALMETRSFDRICRFCQDRCCRECLGALRIPLLSA